MIQKIKDALLNPYKAFEKLVCLIRSYYYSLYIDEGDGIISIESAFINFKIKKDKNSKLIVHGRLSILSYLYGEGKTMLMLGENAVLKVNGDFLIGNKVRLLVSKDGELEIGGRDKESGSGITAETQILVNKRIIIGKDFLCAWGVFITDSDWHTIGQQSHQSDVIIGDHVWIANNSSVLKGSVIGNNSIVAGQSKVGNNSYPPNSLFAEIPAKSR